MHNNHTCYIRTYIVHTSQRKHLGGTCLYLQGLMKTTRIFVRITYKPGNYTFWEYESYRVVSKHRSLLFQGQHNTSPSLPVVLSLKVLIEYPKCKLSAVTSTDLKSGQIRNKNQSPWQTAVSVKEGDEGQHPRVQRCREVWLQGTIYTPGDKPSAQHCSPWKEYWISSRGPRPASSTWQHTH